MEKKGLKERWGKMSRSQKVLTAILGSLVLCSSGVFAAWSIITLTGSATYHIDSSGKGFVMSSNFVGGVGNATAGSIILSDEYEFENLNGLTSTNLTYTLTDNFINVNCTDSTGDYSLDVYYSDNGNPPVLIDNGVLFNVASGTGKIKANLSVVQSACPNNIDLDINVQPLIS